MAEHGAVCHRHQVPECYHGISHAYSAFSIRKLVDRIISLAFQANISAQLTILFLMLSSRSGMPIGGRTEGGRLRRRGRKAPTPPSSSA